MKGKRACVVVNPHAGQNVTQIADLIAVLSAAGAGRYTAVVPVLGMAGHWRLTIAVSPPETWPAMSWPTTACRR